MSVVEDIQKTAEEITAKVAEHNRLTQLAEVYPDLQRYEGRWKKVVYYSKTVNSTVERFDLRHNCGCCPDSPLEIWPYLETPHGKVYSDPPSFSVGERHWMGGDTPYPGWEDKMKAAGIPEIIIGAVGVHFEQDREARISAASE